MKKFISNILFTLVIINCFAQVDTISDNIYQYNGYLGVGVDTPQTQLHIERPYGHVNGATIYLKHGDVGSHVSQNASGGVLHLYKSDSSSQTILRSYGDSYLNANIGNVGIGTTNPTSTLSIESDINSGIERNMLKINNLSNISTSYTDDFKNWKRRQSISYP